MGKKWDYDVPSQAIWEECLRVLKPGGHLLAFAGSRTYHRMAVRIEDAGFDIRDQIMWVYGSGFPKSHNIGKAVDKIQGNASKIKGYVPRYPEGTRGEKKTGDSSWFGGDGYEAQPGMKPVYEINNDYEGWGTSLKPAHEPIVMARKPFKGSVAENVLEWATGGINVDGCRIGYSDNDDPRIGKGYEWESKAEPFGEAKTTQNKEGWNTQGRFPANIIFECTCDKVIEGDKGEIKYSSGSRDNVNLTHEWGYNDIQRTNYTDTGNIHTNPNCPCYILDEQSGNKTGQRGVVKGTEPSHSKKNAIYGDYSMVEGKYGEPKDGLGGASRFFYCPKANKSDRDEGMNTQPKTIKGRDEGQDSRSVAHKARPSERANIHPTVKPTDLMTYLIRLVTPKDGVVLDPFMGSGSTGKAAMREEFRFVGIEREEEYMEIAKQRIDYEYNKRKFF
jgi:site-specific DNA-methyltransferase (adenine-specific)